MLKLMKGWVRRIIRGTVNFILEDSNIMGISEDTLQEAKDNNEALKGLRVALQALFDLVAKLEADGASPDAAFQAIKDQLDIARDLIATDTADTGAVK